MTSVSRDASLPPRPSLPLAFHALIVVLVVEHATLLEGRLTPVVGALLAALAAAALLSRAVERWRAVTPAFACLFMAGCVALGASCAQLWRMDGFVEAMRSSSVSLWHLEVTSDATVTRYGYRCCAHASRAGCAEGDVWLSLGEAVERGDVLQCVGRFVRLADDDWGRRSRAQGVWGSVSGVRVLSHEAPCGASGMVRAIRDSSRIVIEPDASEGRSLLAGCLLGDRRSLDAQGLDTVCSTAGVAHLVAVSGSHIAIVSALLAVPLQRLRIGPWRRTLVLALGSGTFVAICGAPSSAVRAWLMSLCAQGSALVGRRSSSLSSLSVAASMMALANPGVSGQMGYLLSVVCVASLAVFGPYARYVLDTLLPAPWLPRGTRPEVRIAVRTRRKDLVCSLGATLVAQVATIPLVCPTFGTLSLAAPLTNLVASPLMACAMTMGLVACLVQPVPWLSTALMRACDPVLSLLVCLLKACTRIPLASIPMSVDALASALAMAALAAVLWVLWPAVTRRRLGLGLATVLLALLLTFARWRWASPARIVVLDVGQGDAILVQDGHGAVLVDAGPDASIVDALARNHVLHLDAIVITHLHDDHYAGVERLVGVVACDCLVVAQGVADELPDDLATAVQELCPRGVMEVGLHDVLEVGRFDLEVVWPREEVDGSENAHSLEMVASFESGERQLTGLLTGDAERDETGAVLEHADVGDIDFLKVGHHGSAVSITPEQAWLLHPEVAVASAGEGNEYGHPREECREALEGAGALFLCTKDVGDVELRPHGEGVDVRCQR